MPFTIIRNDITKLHVDAIALELNLEQTEDLLERAGFALSHSRKFDVIVEYFIQSRLFVITTDGMENASREFGYDKIKSMIERQKSKYGWEFIFLGANIDAVEIAGRFGVDKSRAQNFYNDSVGIALNYAVVSEAVAEFRAAPCGASLDDNWSEEIQKDFKRRGWKK